MLGGNLGSLLYGDVSVMILVRLNVGAQLQTQAIASWKDLHVNFTKSNSTYIVIFTIAAVISLINF